MTKQLFTKWYVRPLLLLVCGLLLLVVPLLRGSPVGTEAYLAERLANNISLYDSLSFGGRVAAYAWGTPLAFSPWPNILVMLLPFVLGLLSFMLAGALLRRFIDDEAIQNLALLLFIISPPFIYLFSSANALFIPFFLALLTFYLFTLERMRWLTLPLVAIIPIFDIVITAVLLLVLFCYSFFWERQRRGLFTLLLVVGLVVSLMYYGFFYYATGFPDKFSLQDTGQLGIFQSIVFDLGTAYGLSIFVLLLGIIGIQDFWDRKYQNMFIFCSLAFLFVFSFVRSEALLFLNLLLIPFSAYGLHILVKREWTSQGFKRVALFIILLGVVFSGLSQMQRMMDSEPTQAILDGMEFLSRQEEGVVFSHYTRGVWINAAGHANVVDEKYRFVPDAEERFRDVETLYYSRNFEESLAIIEKYEIRYVWIDTGFKSDVWAYETEGLLFILQYTKDFNRIYAKDGVEIWKLER